MLYAFVAVVDPWDTLPLSPPLPRVPISGNARFSMPALARSPRFDAAVVGTSTARLLQPAALDPAFGARFVNLSMNSATPWEQTQILGVFLRAHPAPRAVLVSIDQAWCAGTADRLTPRPFPEWMYGASLWPAYRHMLTPFAVQEAANQLWTVLGFKRPRYGLDGYTRFVPDDAAWDAARVDAAFARWAAVDAAPARPDDSIALPALELLAPLLRTLPPGTRVVLFLPPLHVSQHGPTGSRAAARWAACKQEAAGIARAHGAELVDFLWANALTESRTNFWDPLHYREAVAARVVAGLAGPTPDARRLVPLP